MTGEREEKETAVYGPGGFTLQASKRLENLLTPRSNFSERATEVPRA
jgi:hypothetical protein